MSFMTRYLGALYRASDLQLVDVLCHRGRLLMFQGLCAYSGRYFMRYLVRYLYSARALANEFRLQSGTSLYPARFLGKRCQRLSYSVIYGQYGSQLVARATSRIASSRLNYRVCSQGANGLASMQRNS